MNYVLLGTIAPEWAVRHAERSERAKAKFRELGITLEYSCYMQGPYDFLDVIASPDAEAVLAFALWYSNQGYGRVLTMPAFTSEEVLRAAGKAR